MSMLLYACSDEPSAMCQKLGEHPDGLEVIDWDKGATSAGATWSATLTDTVLYGSDLTRAEVAAAVSADESGYSELLETVDDTDQWAFEELHGLVLDPVRGRRSADDERTEDAAQVIYRLVVDDCGRMP